MYIDNEHRALNSPLKDHIIAHNEYALDANSSFIGRDENALIEGRPMAVGRHEEKLDEVMKRP